MPPVASATPLRAFPSFAAGAAVVTLATVFRHRHLDLSPAGGGAPLEGTPTVKRMPPKHQTFFRVNPVKLLCTAMHRYSPSVAGPNWRGG
ncbi:MAG: hypothetical protein HY700_16085 [Gemmatimonadetes bacterium]|nr:hypothetical protein [Gemmatimonadota bacterium]